MRGLDVAGSARRATWLAAPLVGALAIAVPVAAQPDSDPGEQDPDAEPTPKTEDADGGATGEGGTSEEGGTSAEGGAAGASDPTDAGSTQTCLSSFSAAQAHRRQSLLIEARAELIQCSQAVCPQEIVDKCTPWLREVKAAIPSIIVVARDADGNDLIGAAITLDGRDIAPEVRGLPIEVNPGTHALEVVPSGHAPIKMQVVAVQGEKSRVVVARVAAPPKPVPAPPPPGPQPLPDPEPVDSSGISAWAWVGWSVGAASFIAAGVMGGLALDKAGELDDTCIEKTCNETAHRATFDQGERFAHASTGLFVAGGVATAFGFAALLWLSDDVDAALVRKRWTLAISPAMTSLTVRFGEVR